MANKNSELTVNYSTANSKNIEQQNQLAEATQRVEELEIKVRQFEMQKNQLSTDQTELRNEKERQAFEYKGRIEELELSNRQLTMLHNNAKERLVSLMGQSAQLLERCSSQEQHFNQLQAAYNKEIENSRELVEFQKVRYTLCFKLI